MDAGENPTTKTVAPGNIKNDSTDEKDQKYLAYLKSIMDEKAIENKLKEIAEKEKEKSLTTNH